MRAGVLAVALAAVVSLAGCAGDSALPEAPDLSSKVDVDTPELRAAKREAGVEPCPATDEPGSELPDLTLSCLGGGREVTLSELSGPAVVPLWASWCGPCRDELPLFQQLREEAGDRIDVVGVNWQDVRPGAALALLEETGAVFPQLADPGGELADHYRLTGLPAVLLVDDTGAVTFKLMRIDSYDQLVGLVADHTGVRLAAR